MRRVIIYLILFLFICFSSDWALKDSIGSVIDNQPPYYLSFASIGANLLESRLDCWAKIKTVSSNEEMNQYLILILNHLNLPANENEFLHQENEEISLIQYDLTYNSKNYYFMLQTNKIEKESHFLMTVIGHQIDQDLDQDENKLREILDCKTYYQFKGSIDARPNDAGQKELLRIVMENLGANTNSIYTDEQITSITGFSQILSLKIPPINVEGAQCNVQAALRKNSQNNKTEIYLGFPLLLNDY